MRSLIGPALMALATISSGQVVGTKGMVVSDEKLASQVGAQVLRDGGNAVDAAVATGFALAVVHPEAGNIGGGGFMLIRLADGRSVFVDYREIAPKTASRNMYLDASGKVRPGVSTEGILSGGVPGAVAGMWEAHRKYGKLPWARVIQPAVSLASDGFPVSAALASDLKGDSLKLSRYPETKRVYLRDGRFYSAGETMLLPDLGKTLQRIRDHGKDGFYKGETARLIDQDMRNRGGLIRSSDLAGYKAVLRPALRGEYEGYEILTAPPPSSGGTVLLEMLNIVKEVPKTADPVSRLYDRVEAMKLAFADRAAYFGDPDFVKVPTAMLTSQPYAKKLSGLINLDRATPSEEIKPGLGAPRELPHTTHYSVADKDGNTVAVTTTLNFGFGSGDTITGTGVLLNDEMDDFAAKPGTANGFGLIQGEANAIAPRKRPLSSMTPTIVVKDGQAVLVLGSPGGPTIINTVFEVLLNVVDYGLPIQAAVDAPRYHHQWLPDRLMVERGLLDAKGLAWMKERGEHVVVVGGQGIANCIQIDPKTHQVTGAADKRFSAATAVAE